mmetsp:Transcript_15497/g.35701  ORF Transcript_15497/g.35701 Transcript_15497/m.35701 type:complete len:207 (-) Transcript_15497:485-1105(-)
MPSPTFAVLGEHLAETVASILVLQKNGARINEFLGVLCKHLVNGFSVIHVRKTVSVSLESITDLLQLDFDRIGFVKDDEDGLLRELSSFRVGNRLLDGSKSDEAVTTGSTENHTLKVDAFIGRNNTGDGREAHIQVRTSFLFSQQVGFVRGSLTRGQLANSQTRSVGDEESTSLFQDFLQFHLFVVLNGELLAIGVQLLQLRFVSL